MTFLEEAIALHQELPVVDTHHDIPMDVLYRHKRGEQGVLSGYWGKRLKQGGINVQVLPAFIEDRYLPSLGMREIMRMTEAVLSDLEDDDSVMCKVTSVAALNDAMAAGKIAAIPALEGCDGLGGDVALLRVLYRLGVRMVSLTWERRNEFADGTGIENPGGLTAEGRAAVKEMFAHHVMCDVSHLAQPGFWDVMKLAEGPIIASHSNARSVCDHPRNLTDDQIRAIADTGGVIGLNFYGKFVAPENPTLENMADHLEHMADLVGWGHVGIGADFLEKPIRDLAKIAYDDSPHDPASLDEWIANCQEVEALPRFTAVLLERGYAKEDIACVLGGNFLRVFQQALS
jgi:membrane dipeptidase